MEIRRNFITPTPPILEIRRNRVAHINELCAIRKPAFYGKETVNYDDVVAI